MKSSSQSMSVTTEARHKGVGFSSPVRVDSNDGGVVGERAAERPTSRGLRSLSATAAN